MSDTDNVEYQNQPSGVPTGTVISTDKVDGKHFQRVKIDVGAEGESSLALDIFEQEGELFYIHAVDMEARSLLVSILKEMRKLNIQLSLMTDVEIDNSEVEV